MLPKNIRAYGITSAVLVILTLAGGATVQAYNMYYCGTDAVVAYPLPIHFRFYSKNFTSAQRADVLYAFDAWNDVVGMQDPFGSYTEYPTFDQPPLTAYFDIGGTSSIPGANGVSSGVWDHPNCSPSTPKLIAASTVIATGTGLVTGNASCTNDTETPIRYTILHELAHDIGFAHSTHPTAPSVVMASDVFKYCGRTDERIWLGPDDVSGGRDAYPGGPGSPVKDLAGTSYEMDGTDDTNPLDCIGCASLCPGDSFTIEWSVASLGNQSSGNYNVRFYLSSNATIDSSDILLGTNVDAFMPANSFGKFTRTLTLPAGISHGSSWTVGWNLDWDDNVSERVENNNTGLIQAKIHVCS
jgi:hypothetical protein